LPFAICAANAAVVKRTSVINTGTTVVAKGDASGLYTQACYDSYFGCLDQFCMSDNASGGRCACSDENKKYADQLAAIEKQLANANRLSTIEVEKINAGAQADIVFSGERAYDDKGNVISQQTRDAAASRRVSRVDLSLWNNTDSGDAFDDNGIAALQNKTGDALYSGARQICLNQVPDNCGAELAFLTQLYLTQIRSDCAAFANNVKQKQGDADATLASAQKDVRDARLASFTAANKFGRGQCLVEFKNCMMGPDVCGPDWARCAQYVAAENMQNQKARSTANTTVVSVEKFKISPSTQEMLSSKRNICEGILDQCVAVRDLVWPDFLRDIAPELKTAELNLESNMRQSCMVNISNCIMGKACGDGMQTDASGAIIAGNIDACLGAGGNIARAVCKAVIDPCERMEPKIWEYTVARLRAKAVDRCTQEVKDCFTGTCGADFAGCIGMDYNFMHRVCPLDKLVVCKQAFSQKGKQFSMNDLDDMLLGLYLNIDNSALEVCQNVVQTKMMEVCGSATDCNKFASDENIGTGSLSFQKRGNIYSLTGMMSFGMLNVGTGINANGKADPANAGQVDISAYVAALSKLGVPVNYAGVADAIVYELQNIQGTINRTVDMIARDPKVQFCVTGRDLSQISGKNEKTTPRFPNLLNQLKMQIAVSAIRQATDNYNAKYNQLSAKMASESSIDMANLMCNKLPFSNGAAQGINPSDFDTSSMVMPFVIGIEIAGASNAQLAAGGTHTSDTIGGKTISDTFSGDAATAAAGGDVSKTGSISPTTGAFAAAGGILSGPGGGAIVGVTSVIAESAIKMVATMGSSKQHVEFDGGTRDMWAIFDRNTRNCHYCTSTITKNCKTTGSRGLLGLWDSRGVKCDTAAPVDVCEDIPM